MSLFEQLVMQRGEKHLAPYRRYAEHVSQNLRHIYNSHLQAMQQHYAQAAYWHGTGRYHYCRRDDPRYAKEDTERVVDVLDSIVRDGGLSAHQDLWVRINGNCLETVSVSPTRMHSRLFAHVHLCDGEWLEYVFGGTRFWTGMIFFLVAKELLSRGGGGQRNFVKQALLNGLSLQNAYTWARALRQRDNTLPSVWRAYDLRSDIPGNHPMLFGLKKEAVHSHGAVLVLRWLEVRVPELIPLEHFTHVEVPEARVAEVAALLASKNISLPVIPLEVGELHCSSLPIARLLYA